MVDTNGKTLRSKALKNPSKPSSSKQACNGNCQACEKTCSGEDLVIDCTKCLSRFHLTCSDVSKKIYDILENNKMQQVGICWTCFKCRSMDKTTTSSNTNTSLLSDISNTISTELAKFKSEIGNDVAKINEKISILSKSMDELDASTKKPLTWASVVGDSASKKNTSEVQLLTKKVTDMH